MPDILSHQDQLERTFLSAILGFPDHAEISSVVSRIQPDWFIIGEHRTIIKIIIGLSKKGLVPDPSSVLLEVNNVSKNEDERHTLRDLVMLYDVYTAVNMSNLLQLLKEAYTRRILERDGFAISQAASDPMVDMREIGLAVYKAIDDMMSVEEPNNESTIGFDSVMHKAANNIPFLDIKKGAHLFYTGIPALDAVSKCYPGNTGVMAGKTSAGKTSLAIQSAYETSRKGIPTLIMSLEMSDEEISASVFSHISGLERDTFLLGQHHGFDFTPYANIFGGIKKICHVPARKFEVIIGMMRQAVYRYGIRCIVIDYFSLINPPNTHAKSANTSFILGEMSKGFKALADDLGIYIMLVSQLNRTVADGQRPTLESLRETGQLEQDASQIFMLWSEKVRYEPDEDRNIFIELQKNRGGKRWVKALTLLRPTCGRFREIRKDTEGETFINYIN